MSISSEFFKRNIKTYAFRCIFSKLNTACSCHSAAACTVYQLQMGVPPREVLVSIIAQKPVTRRADTLGGFASDCNTIFTHFLVYTCTQVDIEQTQTWQMTTCYKTGSYCHKSLFCMRSASQSVCHHVRLASCANGAGELIA